MRNTILCLIVSLFLWALIGHLFCEFVRVTVVNELRAEIKSHPAKYRQLLGFDEADKNLDEAKK